MSSSDPPPSYPGSSQPNSDNNHSSSSADRTAYLEAVSRELDRRVVRYTSALALARADPSNQHLQPELTRAAESVAEGMRVVADAHPDPQAREELRRSAEGFGRGTEAERESALRDVGKGLLYIVGTPFVLAGLTIYAAGTIVGGVGSLLKGLGSFGKQAFEKARQNGL